MKNFNHNGCINLQKQRTEEEQKRLQMEIEYLKFMDCKYNDNSKDIYVIYKSKSNNAGKVLLF